jgi:hypothetical protein
MIYTYTELKDAEDNLIGILRNEDKAVIPIDESNADYQEYLKSLES